MKFLTWLIALFLIVCVFRTHRSVRRSRSEAERFFAMRWVPKTQTMRKRAMSQVRNFIQQIRAAAHTKPPRRS